MSWYDIPICKVSCWLIKENSNFYFQQVATTSALWCILKLFVLASWQGFYSLIDPKINPHLCLDMTYPPAKFDVDWSKETQVIVKKTNVWLKTTIFSKLARILQSNWPQKQSPPVSWYDLPTCKVWCWLITGNSSYRKKTNVWRPPAHPPTDILNLITRFHVVKTWLINQYGLYCLQLKTCTSSTNCWHSRIQGSSNASLY